MLNIYIFFPRKSCNPSRNASQWGHPLLVSEDNFSMKTVQAKLQRPFHCPLLCCCCMDASQYARPIYSRGAFVCQWPPQTTRDGRAVTDRKQSPLELSAAGTWGHNGTKPLNDETKTSKSLLLRDTRRRAGSAVKSDGTLTGLTLDTRRRSHVCVQSTTTSSTSNQGSCEVIHRHIRGNI